MRAILLMTLAGMLTLAGHSARGAPGSPERVRVLIESQPLRSALQEFARQTGMQLLRRDENVLIDRTRAPRVEGTFTVREVLEQLLSNTAFRYEFINERTVRIVALPAREAPGDLGETSKSTSVPPDTDATAALRGSRWRRSSTQSVQNVVVVTAQRREEPALEVPISVSVLGGNTLDRAPVEGLSEALTLVPGVATNLNLLGGGTQLTVRGVTAAGGATFGASPVAYYLDSVPFGFVKSAIAPDANAYDLKRVEVLRGPQGTLYGAGGEGGVIRVLTHDADLDTFQLKGRIAASATEDGDGSYRVDGAANVPLVDGKLAARAVVGVQRLGGWIDHPGRRDANDAALRNMRFKLNAEPMPQLSMGLSAWRWEGDYGSPSFSDDSGFSGGVLDQSITTKYHAYGLTVAYEAKRFTATSMTSYADYSTSGALDLRPLGMEAPLLTQMRSRVAAQEISLSSRNERPWSWSGGLFYRNARDGFVQDIPDLLHPDLSDTSESRAVYGQVGRILFDWPLEWTLGLRYFHDNVASTNNVLRQTERDTFSATSPRAVLTWSASELMRVYASWSRGFRSGSPQWLGLTPPQFPSLKPDTLSNFEIGLKADLLDSQLVLEAAVYYMEWRDVQQSMIVRSSLADLPTTALVNGESASGGGFDLSMAGKVLPGLQVGLTFSWNDLTMDGDVFSGGKLLFARGDRLNASPEYTVGTSLAYTIPLGDSGIEASVLAAADYTSRQNSGGRVNSNNPGASMLSSRASISVGARQRWTAALYGDNLGDERGSALPNPFYSGWDSRLRPRTIGLQLDFQL
jgi:iron complex outermembrane recepter protein